jgi:DNA repair protein RecO (recombination protein O)
VGVQLHEGRGELQLITQAETIDRFRVIREDLDRLTKAMSMLEAADQVALPDQPAPELYRMLLRALSTLDSADSPLVCAGFFLKLLALEGSAPEVGGCVVCGSGGALVAFSENDGGLVCNEHRRGVPVSPPAVELLQMMLGGRLGAALNEPASPVTNEVQALATSALERFLERRMKSTTVLES